MFTLPLKIRCDRHKCGTTADIAVVADYAVVMNQKVIVLPDDVRLPEGWSVVCSNYRDESDSHFCPEHSEKP